MTWNTHETTIEMQNTAGLRVHNRVRTYGYFNPAKAARAAVGHAARNILNATPVRIIETSLVSPGRVCR